MTHTIRGPVDPEEIAAFLNTFLYDEQAFLVDEIVSLDPRPGGKGGLLRGPDGDVPQGPRVADPVMR